jgi:hypothetical protein
MEARRFRRRLGSQAPKTWLGRSALYFLWSYLVGLGVMLFGATQLGLQLRDILLGALWICDALTEPATALSWSEASHWQLPSGPMAWRGLPSGSSACSWSRLREPRVPMGVLERFTLWSPPGLGYG